MDYSGSFFRTDLEVTVEIPTSDSNSDEAVKAMNIVAAESSPALVDFSRKDATVYLFKNVHAGGYTFKLHQSFKKGRGSCQAAVAI